MRKITFTLDPASIGQAIREVQRFRKDLLDAVEQLVRELTDEGKEYAQLEILRLGAFDTGELADSIRGYYNSGSRIGIIKTDVYYACFVEYGTGVVGKSSPHPMPNGWGYDVHGHGDSGWVYHSDRDGKFHWTKGYESRPFMYNTFRYLERLAIEKWNSINL